MMQSPPGEPDYAFGQAMLTLRATLGLTQAAVAQHLGISRHAVGAWEAGTKYPSAAHLKHVITLAVAQQAFAAGREAEEIRALWRLARQKVLLDETWLAARLARPPLPAPTAPPAPQAPWTPSAGGGPRLDWGEAPAVPAFYGREWETSLLSEWLVGYRCRVVSVLGLGGIGKSVLVVTLMHQLAPQFEAVIWRSVRDAPACETLLESCLQVLAPATLGQEPATLDARLNLLLGHLRSHRVLLVLDNLESVLAEGAASGQLRPGYDGYGRLLRQVGETDHQSCLVFTSREKPSELIAQEGTEGPVRTLRLARLAPAACARLLADRQVQGTADEQARLIDAYAGNPLALKIVAQTIVDLFGGAIAPFLAQGAVIYGGVRDLLAGQFNRLSALEQSVLCWLAILREPRTLDDLRAVLVAPVPPGETLEAVDRLRRRSLIERGQQPGSFTLQSVVLEYVTARLVAEAGTEIQQGQLQRLITHSFSVALAPEYVRQTQERLIVAPVLEQLQSVLLPEAGADERLLALLAEPRTRADFAQGYGPANIVALLLRRRGDLRGVNMSGLALRGVYFQGVGLQDASLAGCQVRDSVFTQTFDAILSVAISAQGAYLAACSRQGDIRLWSAADYSLQHTWRDPTSVLYVFALSPDELTLAGVNWQGTIKLWDITSGVLLWASPQPDILINNIVFTPDGRLLVTGCADSTVRLWDARTGTQLQVLPHPLEPHEASAAISCSPDGFLLASGHRAGTIFLWALQGAAPARLVGTLAEHTQVVTGLAFAPDGGALASASADGTVKLWDIAAGRLRATLPGNSGPLSRLAWSPDGSTLAWGGHDPLIALWDVAAGTYRAGLRGHTKRLKGLAFSPDSRRLLSGSDDGTLRLWDVTSAQLLHVMQGHALSVYDVRWSPDGRWLVSYSSDQLLTIFDLNGAAPPRLLRGHSRLIQGLAWAPDGRRIASSEQSNTIRLWDADSGVCRAILRDPDNSSTVFSGLDWSPDGRWLAAASANQRVLVWEMTAPQEGPARQLGVETEHAIWSPDGTHLACKGLTGTISVWAATDGTLRWQRDTMQGALSDFAWSADGRRLVAGSVAAEHEAIFVLDAERGALLQTFGGPDDTSLALAWGAREQVVITGSADGKLRWWNVESGECIRVREAHQGPLVGLRRSPDGRRLASCGLDGAIMLWDLDSGAFLQTVRRDRLYERLNITGVQGLTAAQTATLRALGAVEDDALQSLHPEPKG